MTICKECIKTEFSIQQIKGMGSAFLLGNCQIRCKEGHMVYDSEDY